LSLLPAACLCAIRLIRLTGVAAKCLRREMADRGVCARISFMAAALGGGGGMTQARVVRCGW
jgi:hypothetical protein